jgi:hypothetical protein
MGWTTLKLIGLMMGFCENGNEFLSFMKKRNFLVKSATSLLNRVQLCLSVRNIPASRGKFWQQMLGKDSLDFQFR